MYFYCSIKDGYILSAGLVSTYIPGEIGYVSEERYTEVVNAITTKPEAPDGYGYHLREDLTWELYEMPPEEPEPLTETEQKARAFDILMGVSE